MYFYFLELQDKENKKLSVASFTATHYDEIEHGQWYIIENGIIQRPKFKSSSDIELKFTSQTRIK